MDFVYNAISQHQQSLKYQEGKAGERYYKQESDINDFIKYVENEIGQKVPDKWGANAHIATNWHFYFVTQAIQFIMGNGITFNNDDTLKKLGKNFVRQVKKAAVFAKNTARAYGYWNLDHMDVFPFTEFVPLNDEESGVLRAGIRFWQLDKDKPMRATLYEEDGVTEYIKKGSGPEVYKEKRPYKEIYKRTIADGEQLVGGENYDRLPIVPLFNVNDKSDLTGNKNTIDAIDLLQSEMVNGATQANFIYWVFKNVGGINNPEDLRKAIHDLCESHSVSIDEDASMEPHQLNMPYEGFSATIERLIDTLYHNYMGLNVETIRAGAVTATQIAAAYEPLLEKSNLFKDNLTDFISGILELAGIDDEPTFVPSTIANKAEEVQTLLAADEYFDDETMVQQLCVLFGFPEKAKEILRRLDEEDADRYKQMETEFSELQNEQTAEPAEQGE